MSDNTRTITKDREEYHNGDLFVGLVGININGEIGMWFDEENGLCEHERCSKYCEDCND